TSVTIGGSLGGGVDHSGLISGQGTIGAVKIGGYMYGGSGPMAGSIISAADIKGVKIGSYLAGGTGDMTGVIKGTTLGMITITGRLEGGNSFANAFADSGAILGTTITSLTLGGIQGGSAKDQTLARTGYVGATTIKQLKVLGDLTGGVITGTGSLTDAGSVVADH